MGLDIFRYLKTNRINSIQKLQFLMFLYNSPYVSGSGRDFAFLTYLGSEVLVEKILHELKYVGLIEQQGNRYCLSQQPSVRAELQQLAAAFADPLHRQQLIEEIRRQRLR